MTTPAFTEKKITVKLPSFADTERALTVRDWDPADRRKRALTRTAKIVGIVAACALPGLIVHLLLVVMVPALVITLLAAFPLYAHFLGEESTVMKMEGPCPQCGKATELRPFMNSRMAPEVTMLCPECGQTCRAVVATR